MIDAVVMADSYTRLNFGSFPGQPPANRPTTKPCKAEAVLKFESSAADLAPQCESLT
jgi:hypothetical protein